MAFPGVESGHKALSDGGCQQQMFMFKISRDLRLVRRKCVACCLAEKGELAFSCLLALDRCVWSVSELIKIGYIYNLYINIVLCTDVFLLKDLMGS